ncbi:hypothetical protein SAMN04488490_1817 [Marinobacter sp. LV10R510-11A]|uniref:hypothetical protein n=1 Tax=Marinobacter sp. LV10R510-11A TaxID=1415568 RepID=UPI000BB704AF|nr:hypothetical protein [Marinobacter sp. LV10R510-11A]SOB76141.1 hypothetical protein SAMN04488490_1817 [Marinobacter sp. LV10R510-11A]
MADAFGLVWPGEEEIYTTYTPGTDVREVMERYKLRRVPLMLETAKARHADELHQVLKDLTGLVKMASAPLNTYQAAIRNADELLKQIESESTEEESHGQ